MLLACCALFTLAAGARSAVQIADRFARAPLAYSLSAVAAVVYLAASILIRAEITGRSVRRGLVTLGVVELLGVLAVGTASFLVPAGHRGPSARRAGAARTARGRRAS